MEFHYVGVALCISRIVQELGCAGVSLGGVTMWGHYSVTGAVWSGCIVGLWTGVV